MPHESCVICRTRIASNEKKKRKIGARKLWTLVTDLAGTWTQNVELHRTDLVCKSCNFALVKGRQNQLPDPTRVLAPPPQFDLVSSLPMDAYDSPGLQMDYDQISSVPMSAYASQSQDNGWSSTSGESDSQVPDIDAGFWTHGDDVSMFDSQPSSSQSQSQLPPSARRYSGIKSIKTTEATCCLCGKREGRRRIPKTAIIDAWVQLRIRIPFNNRCCKQHIECLRFTPDALELLQPRTDYAMMTEIEVVEWMELLAEEVTRRKLPFDFSRGDMTDDEHKILVGLSKKHFKELLSYCIDMRNSENRTKANALAMLLVKLRLNLSQNVIAIMFRMPSQSAVSESISAVIKSLMTHFVPRHLGYESTTRQEVLDHHSVSSFSTLLEKPDVMILILDGTYLYIQKPGDFERQRQTYNQHKHRNLLKVMMVVTTTGRIIECEGLYYSDPNNNDSKILTDMMDNPITIPSITDFMEAGDCMLLDRGFRDVIQKINDREIETRMPNLLRKPHKQFTDQEANESRQVTMGRWIVEAVNGRLKNKFHFFESTIPASYIPKLNSLLRIACAIINAFSPPIFSPSEDHDQLVQSALQRIHVPNTLKEELESSGLIKRRVVWKEASAESCPTFPTLTEDQLKEITLGTYQIRMGSRYAEQHIKNDATSTFKIMVHRERNDLIRAVIQARFSKSTRHNLWIKFQPDGDDASSIIGWFCKCKTGSRTLGCCSHVAGVMWYLSYARHNLDKIPKHRDMCSGIINATAVLVQDDDMQEEGEGEVVDNEEDEDEFDNSQENRHGLRFLLPA